MATVKKVFDQRLLTEETSGLSTLSVCVKEKNGLDYTKDIHHLENMLADHSLIYCQNDIL